MSRSHSLFSAIVLLSASAMFASPKIVIDKTSYQCGPVIEGKTEKLKAEFIVKNDGDAVLKINARPGCGCTVVKYDSLVQPGKSSTIESEVNIKNYHSGPITKAITVTSNDSTKPSIRLEILATVQGIIDVTDQYINFDGNHPESAFTVKLSSKKKDLAVTEVSFKMSSPGKGPQWQSEVPLPIKFKWTAAVSTGVDGYQSNSLQLYPPALDKTTAGEIIIKTNHPDKSEITLQGNFSK
jgi:hypothetical protein